MLLAAALQGKFPVRRQGSSQQKAAKGGGLGGPPPLAMSLSLLLGCAGRVSAHSSGERQRPGLCSMHYVHLQN